MYTKSLRYRTTTSILKKKSSCELFQAFIVNHQEAMKSINAIKIIICRSLLNDVTNADSDIVTLRTKDSHSPSSVISFLFTFPCTVPLLHFSFFLLTFPSCLLPSPLSLLQEHAAVFFIISPGLLGELKHNNLSLIRFWHFLLKLLPEPGCEQACENEE